MKKLKFEIGDQVEYNGVPREVQCTQKDFSSKEIYIVLSPLIKGKPGIKVSQNELKLLKKAATPVDKFALAKETYKALYGKKVPANKKNDLAWILVKNEEKKSEGKNKETFEAISALSREQLIDLIDEKQLDIEAEDYPEVVELCQAICEELNIDVD